MNNAVKASFAVGVIVGLCLVVWVTMSKRADDQTQIQTALKESIKASKEGRPGGVMDLLSDNLKYNQIDTGPNRNEIEKFIRDSRPDVDVANPVATVAGDDAKIVSPVNLNVNMLGQTRTFKLDKVTLDFHKEPDREFLIFPSSKWRLVSVIAPDNALAGLSLF